VLLCVALCFFGVVGVTDSASARGASASGSVSAAPGDCSKTTALQVAKPFFVWGNEVSDPVAQVLCGPFTGAGSDAMAVTFTAPICWPVQGWAVYGFSVGEWHLLMARRGAFIFPLVAVGADIKETAPVFRSGDPRCVPSGGRHARTWHWDGTHLVAGAWKQVMPRAGVVHLHQFRSPSGNILCTLGDEDRAYCLTWKPPQSVSTDSKGKVRTCTGSRNCTGPCIPGSHVAGCVYGKVPVLAYGQRDEYSFYRCASRTTGVTCTVIRGAAKGKGFFISKQSVRRV
jgi:hypothetical protein